MVAKSDRVLFEQLAPPNAAGNWGGVAVQEVGVAGYEA